MRRTLALRTMAVVNASGQYAMQVRQNIYRCTMVRPCRGLMLFRMIMDKHFGAGWSILGVRWCVCYNYCCVCTLGIHIILVRKAGWVCYKSIEVFSDNRLTVFN